MSEYKLKVGKEGNKVIDNYKKIENGVVGGYKKIEDGAVSGYKKIEKKFVGTFLEEVASNEEQLEEE